MHEREKNGAAARSGTHHGQYTIKEAARAGVVALLVGVSTARSMGACHG